MAEEVALERLAAMLALSRAEERRVAGRLVWLARDWTAPGGGGEEEEGRRGGTRGGGGEE